MINIIATVFLAISVFDQMDRLTNRVDSLMNESTLNSQAIDNINKNLLLLLSFDSIDNFIISYKKYYSFTPSFPCKIF